jgi:hypothetical protein
MNLLGRRSLSSFFKVLIDVAFYAACLAGALLVVVAGPRTGPVSSSVSSGSRPPSAGPDDPSP